MRLPWKHADTERQYRNYTDAAIDDDYAAATGDDASISSDGGW